jgi:hypothetical protein
MDRHMIIMQLLFFVSVLMDPFQLHFSMSQDLSMTEKIEEYKAAFMARHPLLQDCWEMMDELKLYLQQAGNTVI